MGTLLGNDNGQGPEITLASGTLEKILIDHGFVKTESTQEVDRFDHERAPFPCFIKIPPEGHLAVRQCLVAHPELLNERPQIVDIPGITVDFNWYYHVHAHPIYTGQKEKLYGVTIEFETPMAFKSFVTVVLSSPPEVAAVLSNEEAQG